MLFRFSLYGFLKNQRYFEPFLVLAFLAKGLSYFEIGLLIGFRELVVNILEIPSGAVADLFGKRSAMIISFGSYILSFLCFGLFGNVYLLLIAMLFFSVGEAFRTGTHKAMIFTWLEKQGRIKERTKVYGYTRSWSKMGSALSSLIAGGLVVLSITYKEGIEQVLGLDLTFYDYVFFFTIIPYIIGIINFLGYPDYVDGEKSSHVSLRDTFLFLKDSLVYAFKHRSLRNILLESMAYEGLYNSIKDYIQPIIKNLAMGLPILLIAEDKVRSAILIALVYSVLFLLESLASRKSDAFSSRQKGPERATMLIWAATLILFVALFPALLTEIEGLAVLIFIFLAVLQNLWRPIQISRIDDASESSKGATVLSIESQGKSAFTMVLAPLLGLSVDSLGLWSIAPFGIAIALVVFILRLIFKNKGPDCGPL